MLCRRLTTITTVNLPEVHLVKDAQKVNRLRGDEVEIEAVAKYVKHCNIQYKQTFTDMTSYTYYSKSNVAKTANIVAKYRCRYQLQASEAIIPNRRKL